MVLDALKATSDDAFYDEEHVLFLLGRVRTALLLKKYRAQRRYANSPVSLESFNVNYQNYQNICFGLESADLLPESCGGSGWLKSTMKMPTLLGIGTTQAFPVNILLGERTSFIPIERMPFVGYNRWLQSMIYVAQGTDGYLYVRSANPQFKYLKSMRLHGVFEDAEAAAAMRCKDDGTPAPCDILDAEFPMEDALLAECIEFVVAELKGTEYAPMDKTNNAEDDLAKASVSAPANTER